MVPDYRVIRRADCNRTKKIVDARSYSVHFGRGIPVQDALLDGFTSPKDGSLDEPMVTQSVTTHVSHPYMPRMLGPSSSGMVLWTPGKKPLYQFITIGRRFKPTSITTNARQLTDSQVTHLKIEIDQPAFASQASSHDWSFCNRNKTLLKIVPSLRLCCCCRLLFTISSFVSAASWRPHPLLGVVLRCRRRSKSTGTHSPQIKLDFPPNNIYLVHTMRNHAEKAPGTATLLTIIFKP